MSNIIKGRWRWNDVVYCKWQATHKEYDIAFKCNAEAFRTIFLDWSVGYHSLTYIDVNSNYVLAGRSQNEGDDFYSVDEAYRIMDFGETDQLIDDELYNFISENAEPYLAPLTIAEKLAVIAENEPKVYDAGYNSGYKVGFEEGKAGDGYGEGFEAGKQAEYDAFWNMIQDHGNRTDYGQAFRNWRSSTEYLRPKYKVVPTASTSAMNTFYNCEGLKKVEAEYFDFSKKARGGHQGYGWYHTFTTCGELEEIEDIGIMPDTDLTNTFQYCTKLKKISMIRVDVNTVISSTVLGSCPALESVTFDGEIGYGMDLHWSTKLNRASIESIINHLSDNVSGKTLTLSKAAVDEAFKFDLWGGDNGDILLDVVYGTDENNPYWWILRNTKLNWEIVYS